MRYTDPENTENGFCEGSAYVKTKIGNNMIAGNGVQRGYGRPPAKHQIPTSTPSLPTIRPTGGSFAGSVYPLDPSLIFTPFAHDDPLIYCQLDRCNISISAIPGEYRFDWSRVDKFGLFLDVGSLGMSIIGLPPVSKLVGINTKPERMVSQSLNVGVSNAGTFNSIGNGDGMGIYLTGVGLIFPQLSIPSSAGSVINDLSEGFYFVPTPVQGPPAGPYCDGKYYC